MNQAQGRRLALASAVTADNSAPANGTAATQTLTLTGNTLDGLTVTIGTTVYTFKDALSGGSDAYEVLVGATASDSLDNLIAAVNDSGGVEGTDYGRRTAKHPDVFAAAGAGDTVDIAAKVVGTDGNAIATTETLGGEGSWGGATMSGGVDRDGLSLEDAFGSRRPNKYALEIVITGTGALECDAYIYGYERAGTYGNDGEYSRLGSGSAIGHVNSGSKITGTTKVVWKDMLVNLGFFSDVYLEIDNRSGTSFSLNAILTAIEEV